MNNDERFIEDLRTIERRAAAEHLSAEAVLALQMAAIQSRYERARAEAPTAA